MLHKKKVEKDFPKKLNLMKNNIKKNFPTAMEWFVKQATKDWSEDDLKQREWTKATNSCWYLGSIKNKEGYPVDCNGVQVNGLNGNVMIGYFDDEKCGMERPLLRVWHGSGFKIIED